MLNMTKKIAIAASLVAFCSGPFDAVGTEIEDGDQRRSLTSVPPQDPDLINHVLNKDTMQLILYKASENTTPYGLASVCKHWFNFMGKVEELPKLVMNPFMKNCRQIFWGNQFYNGILHYTPIDGSAKISLRFSDIKDGTFDLSACGNAPQQLVITTRMDLFFEIEGGNKDKLVTGIVPYHWVEKAIKANPSHHFAKVFANWNPDKAPLGIFWRWGNDDPAYFDYLTNEMLADISSRNLFENWLSPARLAVVGIPAMMRHVRLSFFMFIFEPK
jgi:hypothetical protein